MADGPIDASGEAENDAIIPEEDFREAIAACCRDPQLNRMFKQAPTGAKLFIGLGFYSTHFGDSVVPEQYAECLAEIEPALTVNDLKYLIRFERDKQTKAYLKGLLAQREKDEAAAATAQQGLSPDMSPSSSQAASTPEAAPQTPDDYIPVPRRKRSSFDGVQRIQSAQEPKRYQGILKVAASVAVVVGLGAFLYLSRNKWRGDNVAGPVVPPTPIHDEMEAVQTGKVEVAVSSVTSAPPAVVKDVAEIVSAAFDTVAEIFPSEQTDSPQTDSPPTDSLKPAIPKSDAPVRVADDLRHDKKATQKSAVVLTDGIKIVKLADGRIEVPRRFSCAGAGIKPFWVYGANPEVEAAKEKRAREEWEELRRVAQ